MYTFLFSHFQVESVAKRQFIFQKFFGGV